VLLELQVKVLLVVLVLLVHPHHILQVEAEVLEKLVILMVQVKAEMVLHHLYQVVQLQEAAVVVVVQHQMLAVVVLEVEVLALLMQQVVVAQSILVAVLVVEQQ
jgi:hypothetical protein